MSGRSMRIRARVLQPSKRTVTVTLSQTDEASPITLHQLKQAVCESLAVDPASVGISLNGTSPLEGDDSTLDELGIVHGDLVQVLGSNGAPCQLYPPAAASLSPAAASPSSSAATSSPMNDGHKKVKIEHGSSGTVGEVGNAVQSKTEDSVNCTEQDMEVANTSSCSDEIMDDEDGIQDGEVNKYLREPMLVRESTPAAVPQTLTNTFHAAEIKNPGDAVCGVIHVLMYETGFQCKHEGVIQKTPDQFTGLWQKSGVYHLKYVHSGSSGVVYEVMCVAMGSVVIIHGLVTELEENAPQIVDKIQMKIKPSYYICENQKGDDVALFFKNLPRLSREFKDAVAYPLLLKGTEAVGADSVFTVPSLATVMYEVKLTILRHLDAATLLRISETCQEFYSISREPSLWRRLFLRDYGRRATNNELSQDWFALFRDKFVLRKKMQEQMMRHRASMHPPYIHRPYPPLVLPPQFQPPFVIGGDYDRDPFAAGIGPGNLGHQPLLPRPRQLFSSRGQLPNNPNNCLGGRHSRGPFGGFQMF